MTIDHYLDDLCASLAVDSLRRDEIRLETHLHLKERVEDLVSQGMDRARAEERATQEFGEPSETAARLSENRPLSFPVRLKTPVRNVAILMIVLGVQYFSGLLFIVSDLANHPHPFTWQRVYPLLLEALPLIAGIGLLRGRWWSRWAGIVPAVAFPAFFLTTLPMRSVVYGGWWRPMAGLPTVILWLYVLWTLLHPRNWKMTHA
jgi:hypothetical protein